MRNDASIVAILNSVQAATPEPVVLTNCSLMTFPDPGMRRAFRLAVRGRLQTFEALSLMLALDLDVPEWLAQLAMNAAIPDGRERDLDDPAAHDPALLRAKVAMGFQPCRPVQARAE